MKMGDKVIVYGYIDGYSYETTGQTNYIIALETGERVEIPLGVAINADEIVFKDNIKLKDVIKRIQGFDDGTKLKWTYDILQELGSDFGSKIFHEAYQQGKFEGSWVGNQLKDADKIRQELNKPVVKQFVADWYEENKDNLEFYIFDYVYRFDQQKNSDFKDWLDGFKTEALQTLVNMHQFGYEVEKEKKYLVKLKGASQYLRKDELGTRFSSLLISYFTRNDIEDLGFGWVFDCEGIEVEEIIE